MNHALDEMDNALDGYVTESGTYVDWPNETRRAAMVAWLEDNE